MALTNFLKDIADAIRYAEQSNAPINAQQFATRIRALSGGQPTPTPIPQTGTWQLKTTSRKKYIMLGTDDDYKGNTKVYRMLRTFGFPYKMNVTGINVDKNIGSDIDTTAFLDTDAPALFPNETTSVSEVARHIYNNNLGEIALHGGNDALWNSDLLVGTVLDELYATYTSQGGTKTKEELRTTLMELGRDYDTAQDAPYVENSRKLIENGVGCTVQSVGIWGGGETFQVDGVDLNLVKCLNASSYDWRKHNYKFASVWLNNGKGNSRNPWNANRYSISTNIATQIADEMWVGDVRDYYTHWWGDFTPTEWRTILTSIKALVDSGEVEVITGADYYEMGEFVTNPITSIALSRNGNLKVGDTDTDDAYVLTINYQDGTSITDYTERYLDRSKVDTSASGTYEVSAIYRGFSTKLNVTVSESSGVELLRTDIDVWNRGRGKETRSGFVCYIYSCEVGATYRVTIDSHSNLVVCSDNNGEYSSSDKLSELSFATTTEATTTGQYMYVSTTSNKQIVEVVKVS